MERLGRIERVIVDAFAANPCATFDTIELVDLAFPGAQPEKKHTSAVLRAARRLSSLYVTIEGLQARAFPWTVIYVNAESVRSLSLGKLRAHFGGSKSVTECEAMLDDPTSEPHALAQPGGYWHLMATRTGLLADGRANEAAAISARIQAIVEADRLSSAQEQRAAA